MDLRELLEGYKGVTPIDGAVKARRLWDDLQELGEARPEWSFLVCLIKRNVQRHGMVFPNDLIEFLEGLGFKVYDDLVRFVAMVDGKALLEAIDPQVTFTRSDVFSQDDIVSCVSKQCYIESDCAWRFMDNMYYPFLERELPRLLSSPIDSRAYVKEAHDCDDFARELKAWLSSKGYGNMTLGYAEVNRYSGSTRVGAHALNLAVLTGRRVVFIEPQTDKVYDPKDSSVWGTWDVQKVRYVEF